jgi:hypothetical protein
MLIPALTPHQGVSRQQWATAFAFPKSRQGNRYCSLQENEPVAEIGLYMVWHVPIVLAPIRPEVGAKLPCGGRIVLFRSMVVVVVAAATMGRKTPPAIFFLRRDSPLCCGEHNVEQIIRSWLCCRHERYCCSGKTVPDKSAGGLSFMRQGLRPVGIVVPRKHTSLRRVYIYTFSLPCTSKCRLSLRRRPDSRPWKHETNLHSHRQTLGRALESGQGSPWPVPVWSNLVQ